MMLQPTSVLTFTDWPVSLQKVWLQVHFKEVASNPLYCVIHWQDMDPLSVLHIRTWLNAKEDIKLNTMISKRSGDNNLRKWLLFPHLMTSPSRTLRLLRTTLFMRTFSSEQLSSDSTMHTVSRLFFPFISTVSPRKS